MQFLFYWLVLVSYPPVIFIPSNIKKVLKCDDYPQKYKVYNNKYLLINKLMNK